jgi:hypothetical protein
MREQYREILEDAIASSQNREDFDEMLLRSTKKQLPMKYHTHFLAMIEEVLKEAESRGMTNRQAAQQILNGMKDRTPPPVVAPPEALPRQPVSAGPARQPSVLEAVPVMPKGDKRPADVASEPPRQIRPDMDNEPEDGPSSGEGEPADAPKILDLGGVHPETLPPEVKDKLSKMVKVEKQKAEWGEAPDEAPAPGIFFKGSQRCAPDAPEKKTTNEPEKKKLKRLKSD